MKRASGSSTGGCRGPGERRRLERARRADARGAEIGEAAAPTSAVSGAEARERDGREMRARAAAAPRRQRSRSPLGMHAHEAVQRRRRAARVGFADDASSAARAAAAGERAAGGGAQLGSVALARERRRGGGLERAARQRSLERGERAARAPRRTPVRRRVGADDVHRERRQAAS